MVGIIIKTVNKITAGAAHRKINALRPDRFLIQTPPFSVFKKAAVKHRRLIPLISDLSAIT
jgi:hypothetical protein